MSRQVFFMCLLVLCLGMMAGSAYAAGVNILHNPGFENDLVDWGVLRGGSIQTVVNDPAVAHSGSKCVMVYNQTVAGGIEQGAYDTWSTFLPSPPNSGVPVTISDAKSYRLSAWVKIPIGGTADTLKLRYRWQPSGQRVDVGNQAVAADGVWVKLQSGWLKPVAGDNSLGYFEVWSTSAGITFYVDDCMLEEVDTPPNETVISGSVTGPNYTHEGIIVTAAPGIFAPTMFSGTYSIANAIVGQTYTLTLSNLPLGKVVATAPAPFVALALPAGNPGKDFTLKDLTYGANNRVVLTDDVLQTRVTAENARVKVWGKVVSIDLVNNPHTFQISDGYSGNVTVIGEKAGINADTTYVVVTGTLAGHEITAPAADIQIIIP